MELSDLRAFLAISEARSLSAAARSMKLPKSSLSRALVRLEGTVGAVLIERSTRHLRLTDAGAILVPHARRIIENAEEAQAALEGLAEVPKGTLKINVTHTFAVSLLTPMVSGFMKDYPAVRLVLDISNRSADLAAEGIDLAIRIGPLPDSGMIARRLATVELWLCASPAYLSERGTPKSPKNLAGHRLVTRADEILCWRFWSARGAALDFEVIPGTVIPEPAATREVLIGGGGIGRLPDYLAAGPIAKGTLVRLFPDLRPETVDVSVVFVRELTAKTRVFIESLAKYLTGREGGGG